MQNVFVSIKSREYVLFLFILCVHFLKVTLWHKDSDLFIEHTV